MDAYGQHALETVDFLERNLKNRVTIEDVARVANYSQWHLQRKFREATGFTVKDYLRKRRLAQAARELAELDRRVLDVALDFGFSHEQSFIRAFEQEFGTSPGAFRRKGLSLEVTSRLAPGRPPFGATGRGASARYFYRPARTIIGPRVYFGFRENEAESTTIRIKEDFARKASGCAEEGTPIHAYVQLVEGDSYGAWFSFGYEASAWRGGARGYHETAIPAHVAASLDVPLSQPLRALRVPLLIDSYAALRARSLSRYLVEEPSFNYTLLGGEFLAGKSPRLSINIPVEERAE